MAISAISRSVAVTDLIVCNGVLQHTRSPELAFRELVRALATDGALVIGNSYPPNLHNRRVSMHRLRLGLHVAPRPAAKAFIRRQARIYAWLVRLGLWRLHRRFPLPGLIEFNNIPRRAESHYFANACDYYLPRFRHMIDRAELVEWAKTLLVSAEGTPKGVKIVKRDSPS